MWLPHLLGAVCNSERVTPCLQNGLSSGTGSCSFLAIPQWSATELSAAGFAGAISHGTSNRRLPTVISSGTVNAMPLIKIRTWDQTLHTTSSGGKGGSAVTAASREVLCHSCWTYTRGWYCSAINKSSSFVLSFTFKKSVWIRHYFCWVQLQHSELQSKEEEGHKDGVIPG